MMTTSVVNLLQPKSSESTDELASMLESLPSYENLQESREQSAIFDEESEPPSGLINLIRRDSVRTVQSITTNDAPNTVCARIVDVSIVSFSQCSLGHDGRFDELSLGRR